MASQLMETFSAWAETLFMGCLLVLVIFVLCIGTLAAIAGIYYFSLEFISPIYKHVLSRLRPR